MNNILKFKSKSTENFTNKVQTMQDMVQKILFDINPCKCFDFEIFSLQCPCKLKHSVNFTEHDFFSDSRSERCIAIAGLPIAATKANKKRRIEMKMQELCSNIINLHTVYLDQLANGNGMT